MRNEQKVVRRRRPSASVRCQLLGSLGRRFSEFIAANANAARSLCAASFAAWNLPARSSMPLSRALAARLAALPSCLSSYNHPSVRRSGGGGNGGKRQCTCISWDPLSSAHSTSTSSGIGSLILSELMAPFGVQPPVLRSVHTSIAHLCRCCAHSSPSVG